MTFCYAESWTERWQPSTWKSEENLAGKFEHAAGDWYGHPEAAKVFKTTADALFYTIWAELDKEFINKGKDLILQVSLQFFAALFSWEWSVVVVLMHTWSLH